MSTYTAPQWQKELQNFVGIKSAFIIEGNVSDLYPYVEDEQAEHPAVEFLPLDQLLPRLFQKGAARNRRVHAENAVASSPTSVDGTNGHAAANGANASASSAAGENAPAAQAPAAASALAAPAYQFLFCDPLRGITDPLGSPDASDIVRAATQAVEALQQETSALNAPRQEPYADNRLVHNSMVVRAALTRRLNLDESGRARQGGLFGGGTRANASSPAPSPSSSSSFAAAPNPEARVIAEPAPAPRASLACVYSLASRLTSRPSDLSAEENAVFMNLLIGCADAIRADGVNRNALVLVVNKRADVPPWFFANNPEVRPIVIPNPDRDARKLFVSAAFGCLAAPELASVREKFVDITDSMKIRELDELRRLQAKSATPAARIAELVDVYKYGLKENKWAAIADKLRDAPEEKLRQRVKGQNRAVDKIVTVLKRSVMGFSGMQHSSGTKPKGVLFLAGPTGTGKTEIVKATTELLFGDERSYLRFDMSEYASENSDQKLFGAPPGYVGYEEGGQLTNAVKANPFSVLLFDEVEKAHPSIMDKFLQILEDGRMTDGQGNTVYFSESLIFFTSNVGISEEVLDEHGRAVGRRNIVQPGEPYDEIERKVNEAMATHFKPEVLNRIGENIVVFDYIDASASALIVGAQLAKINRNIEARCGIRVKPTPACTAWLCERALDGEVREKGGRGIGNLVESRYLNPLSTFIFDAAVRAGESIVADASPDVGRLSFLPRACGLLGRERHENRHELARCLAERSDDTAQRARQPDRARR